MEKIIDILGELNGLVWKLTNLSMSKKVIVWEDELNKIIQKLNIIRDCWLKESTQSD